MAKTKAKKSTKATKAPARSKASSAKKPSKSAAAKKAARSASSAGTPVPGSTDIRKAFKSYLLADYLGDKKPRAGSSKKAK